MARVPFPVNAEFEIKLVFEKQTSFLLVNDSPYYVRSAAGSFVCLLPLQPQAPFAVHPASISYE